MLLKKYYLNNPQIVNSVKMGLFLTPILKLIT